MVTLIAGLILFLGIHSTRIVAEGPRQSFIDRFGENAWKGVYSLVALAGIVLVVWGYPAARAETGVLWEPLGASRLIAMLLMLPAFIFVVASNTGENRIKATLKHPMLAGVMLWAIAHLLANGAVADALLFGSFLIWAIVDRISAGQRDRAGAAGSAAVISAGSFTNDIITVAVGTVLWLGFMFFAHEWLFGVSPVG